MSDSKSFCRSFAMPALLVTALVITTAQDSRAGICKPNGQQCQTNQSCCTRNCAKPVVRRGASLFGICCPTGNKLCNGVCVNLATDSNNCGACGTTCTTPDTCGGGGTAGQCGCTPTMTCATEGFDCGAFMDDCGEMVSCGSCTAPETCGASEPNVCGTTTTTSTTIPTTTSTTTPTTTTTMPGSPGCFVCPPEDQLGFGLGQSDTSTDPIFCSYPAVEGEDPFDFFCTYSRTTGVIVEDHDAGLCQPNAVNTNTCASTTTTPTSTTIPTTTTTMPGSPGCFVCPPEDQLGFPVAQSNTSTDPIFCSYPAVEGEDPFDFFCTYSRTTGVIVEDHDAGLCQPNAVNTCV